MNCSGDIWKRKGLKITAILCLLSKLACAETIPFLFLPAQITVSPPWHALPVSQPDLNFIFSNSSPFSFTQSLLIVPSATDNTHMRLQASFGPYSVSQVLSSPLLPLSSHFPPLSVSLLSKTVEREGDRAKGENFKVRALFHWRGNSSSSNCVTLHAFKETEEEKSTCVTQPPLGLCIVILTLPKAWFDVNQQGFPDQTQAYKSKHLHRHRHRGERHTNLFQRHSGHLTNNIQLYYSTSGSVSNVKLRCFEDIQDQSQKRLYHLGAVTLEEKHQTRNRVTQRIGCSDELEEELKLDSNVFIGYQKGPVYGGEPVGVSISLTSNFTGDIIVRMKVKKGLLSLVAHHSVTTYPWTIILEKNTDYKHETFSIICHRVNSYRGRYSSPVSQQVACLSVIGLHKNFQVAMTVTAQWWVEYSGRNNPLSPHRGVMSTFSFTDRDIVGVTPLTKSDTIINTAILTSQPVSLPVTVLAVARDGKVFDITAVVTCQSTNEDVVKVSSDCSALYVDGSESGEGSTCVVVEFSFGAFHGILCLSVWAPVIPLLISVSDPVLNSIEGWSYYTGTECAPVFQRSAVQVLAQFATKPLNRGVGQLTYMLDSPDWFIDVTELVSDWLNVRDPQVASIDKQHNVVGLHPGVTSLQVISGQWDRVLGSCDVIVTDDSVVPGDLSVQVVGRLSMSVKANPTHPSVITATVTGHNTLYGQGQEASLNTWLQFSDDTAILLSAFSTIPFSLRLSSLAESVVILTPSPNQRVIAQGDGGGPLIKAELLVSTCQPTSNAVHRPTPDVNEGGIRRLAKGSGWVRINFDFQALGNEDPNGISQMHAQSDLHLYNSLGDNSTLYNSQHNISFIDELDKAILTLNHEDSDIYFSAGMGKGDGPGQKEEQKSDLGVGAVISVFFLSSFLFLVNYLPCALRDRIGLKECLGAEELEKGIEGEDDNDLTDVTDKGESSLQWKSYCLF